jgi:cytochrome c5
MFSKSLKTALLIGAALACGVATASASAPDSTPPAAGPAADPGKAIVTKACQSCHDLGMVTEARHTAKEWAGVLERMRANGADLSDDEAKQVQAYLAKVYGKPG